MEKSLVGIILATLANILLIFLFLQFKKIKTNIGNSIPAHTHEPNVIDSSGDDVSVGLNQEEVDARIRELAPKLVVLTDDSGNVYHNATVQELGFEYQNNGDKLIFNKDIEFNDKVDFNKPVNFAWDTASVFFGSPVDFARSNTRIRAWNNMIAPFFIDFNDGGEISNLERKYWYLCDGGDVINKWWRCRSENYS